MSRPHVAAYSGRTRNYFFHFTSTSFSSCPTSIQQHPTSVAVNHTHSPQATDQTSQQAQLPSSYYPNMTTKTDQTFSFEIVACLLAAMAAESNTTVGAKHYALMAKIDGAKTQSGYEHMFRAAKNKAKDFNDKLANGELDVGGASTKGGAPSGKAKGASKKSTPTGSSKKRGREAASEIEDGGSDESPSKKVKAEADEEDEYV